VSILVDTNVLLRRTQPGHPNHEAAVESIARLTELGERGCVTLQIIAEFWNAATRPLEQNGLGFSVELTLREIGRIESTLMLLHDNASIHAEWKRLVTAHRVIGSKVHDARLVAAMNVHGVAKILTFNGADFRRYPVEIVHPAVAA
jgi:predicted nucleic acid-binding protein